MEQEPSSSWLGNKCEYKKWRQLAKAVSVVLSVVVKGTESGS